MDKKQVSAFPVGEPMPEQFSKYFTGEAYLAPLTRMSELNCPVSNVTFAPSCRNNWHAHTGGQLLIAVGGRGYYQEKGKPARELVAGDVVEIAPDVIHWHGAAPDSWFAHLAVATNPQTNVNTWLERVDDAQYAEATSKSGNLDLQGDALKNIEAWASGQVGELAQNDPELAAIFGNFAFGEVMSRGRLDRRQRLLVTLASTIAQNTREEFRLVLRGALSNGISPVEIKEVLYQAVAYTGIARVRELLTLANEELTARGIPLPLEPQATVTAETRQAKGLALQKDIFGPSIDRMYEASPANQLHFQHYLSANCFGDYQTRPALDKRMRELLTFAMLISLGGCEPQVKGHIHGNVAVGNDKETLIETVTQLLPYIGYPRTLNALACLNEILPEK